MQKYISLLGVLLSFVYCSSAQAAQRAYGIEPCSDIVEFEGEAYFCGEHHRLGRELFRTNGTPEGTFVVTDIDTGPGSSDPQNFFELRGKLYFFAETTGTGREIWRTDGTEQGTKRITDALPGPDGFHSDVTLFNDGGRAYFSDRSGWWRTDGSSDGTELILERGDAFVGPNILGLSNNAIYFQRELPSVGGLPAGGPLERLSENSRIPQVVKDFGIDCFFENHQVYDGVVNPFKNNPKLYIQMDCFSNTLSPGVPGISLVATDGTLPGTQVVIRGPAEFLGALGNQRYYFNSNNAKIEYTDGINTETLGVCDGPVPCFRALNEHRFKVNDKIVFTIRKERPPEDTLDFIDRVYSSDGTLQGTTEIAEGQLSASQVVGARALFTTLDRTLWTSDGTSSGTRILRSPDSSFRPNRQIYGLGSQFVFFEKRPDFPLRLWRSGGLSAMEIFTFPSASNRVRLASTEGSRLYFELDDFLWHSDATEEGTYRLTYLEEIAASPPFDSNVIFIYPVLDLLLEERQ